FSSGMASPLDSLHRYIVTSLHRYIDGDKAIETRSAPASLAATLAALPSISPIPSARFTILNSRLALLLQPPPNPAQRIIKIVHDALFQRNDSVVRDLDTFGTNLGATLGNVAVTDPVRLP